jgi:hypothetical protein
MQTPQSLRLFFLCLAGGFALAALFLGGLIATNAGAIGTLLHGPRMTPLPLVVLWFLLGTGFAGGQWATAVALPVRSMK